MKRIVLVTLLISVFSGLAQAEYRVFSLHLLNSKTNVVRQIETTLDPDQYQGFYPLHPDEKLTYVQTWRCKGRTDFFTPHCQKPDRAPTKAQN